MKDQYEVTIGIPVYKSLDFIRDTVTSALNQTFPDIEFLIVDDCGQDGTMDVVSQIQNSHQRGNDIRILKNESNKGVGYSRNRMIDEARGRYLYFMDSDDTIEPNTIQLLYDTIIQNRVQIAYGSYEIIDGIGNSPIEKYQKDALVLKGEDELAMYAFKNNHIFHVSVCNHLVDLAFLRQSGVRFIDTSYWEDMVFTTELVTIISSAVLLPDITYHYYRHSGSLSHYQDREIYDKIEIMENASVLNYLKAMCLKKKGKNYLPYLCYNIEMTSFYMACHIIRNIHRINPMISSVEIRNILRCPFSVKEILIFRYKRIPNLLFTLLGMMPIPFFRPSIWVLGKLKKAI